MDAITEYTEIDSLDSRGLHALAPSSTGAEILGNIQNADLHSGSKSSSPTKDVRRAPSGASTGSTLDDSLGSLARSPLPRIIQSGAVQGPAETSTSDDVTRESPSGASGGVDESSAGWSISIPAPERTTTSFGISQRSITSCTTLEELEDTTYPVYLRDSSTYRMFLRETKKRANENLNCKSRQKETPSPSKWKVQEVDFNSWRKNRVDHQTIYASKEVTVIPTPMPPPRMKAKPSEDSYTSSDHLDFQQEKRYIQEATQQRVLSPKNAVSNTIQEYNKPLNAQDGTESYGSPKHSLDIKNLIPKKPAYKTMPCQNLKKKGDSFGDETSREHEVTCEHQLGSSYQFCDVLGPSSCNKCIEGTNRRIASDLQREGLPDLDSTVTTMIAPKLALLMAKGDRLMTSRRRKAKRKKKVKDKGEVLKLPALGGRAGGSEGEGKKREKFGRAGVERVWEKKAREFHKTCQQRA